MTREEYEDFIQLQQIYQSRRSIFLDWVQPVAQQLVFVEDYMWGGPEMKYGLSLNDRSCFRFISDKVTYSVYDGNGGSDLEEISLENLLDPEFHETLAVKICEIKNMKEDSAKLEESRQVEKEKQLYLELKAKYE